MLSDPLAYRANCLDQTFGNVVFGSTIFQGIALPYDDAFRNWLQDHGRTPTLTFLRLSPAGQAEPHYVHSDVDMGTWTAILYLNPTPHQSDGTRFWQTTSGAWMGESVSAERGHDLNEWTCWREVAAAFNRCVVFDARLFHSRSLVWNYGAGSDARLIQVAFGTE